MLNRNVFFCFIGKLLHDLIGARGRQTACRTDHDSYENVRAADDAGDKAKTYRADACAEDTGDKRDKPLKAVIAAKGSLGNINDGIVDVAKATYKAADAASDIKKATGTYEILFKSGKNYVGKGGFKRAIMS